MNNRIHLVELQRTWTPPDGLDRCRPREVRLAKGGIVMAIVIALFAGAVASAVGLARKAAGQAEESRLLREQGVDIDSQVTRLWRIKGESPENRVAYAFSVEHRVYEGKISISLAAWKTLEVGSTLGVRYLPSNPDVNYPRRWQRNTMPMWVPYVVALSLAVLGGLALLPVLRQRRLLEEGRAAMGIVTRLSEERHGSHGHNGRVVYYEFPLLSGAIANGKSGPSRNPPAVGSTLCILYDPEQPRRNAPYPLSLVMMSECRRAPASKSSG